MRDCSFHSQTLNFGSSLWCNIIYRVKIASCNAISQFPLPDLIFWVIFAAQYSILGQNCQLQCNIAVSTPRPHILGHLCGGAILYIGSKSLVAMQYCSFHSQASYFGSKLLNAMQYPSFYSQTSYFGSIRWLTIKSHIPRYP